MEERQLVKPQNHRLVINNRKTGTVTGVLDVLSFDLNEILLETEQGMLMVKGTDMHVNRLNLESIREQKPEKICCQNCFGRRRKNVWYRN